MDGAGDKRLCMEQQVWEREIFGRDIATRPKTKVLCVEVDKSSQWVRSTNLMWKGDGTQTFLAKCGWNWVMESLHSVDTNLRYVGDLLKGRVHARGMFDLGHFGTEFLATTFSPWRGGGGRGCPQPHH